jgi:hypothetical protein
MQMQIIDNLIFNLQDVLLKIWKNIYPDGKLPDRIGSLLSEVRREFYKNVKCQNLNSVVENLSQNEGCTSIFRTKRRYNFQKDFSSEKDFDAEVAKAKNEIIWAVLIQCCDGKIVKIIRYMEHYRPVEICD